MNPTPEQSAIFSALSAPGGSVIISAVAGSGKTTTLVEALKLIPSGVDPETFMRPAITFLAFNKTIADTLRARVPSHVSCSTFHSLGLRALSASPPRKPEVDGRKVGKLVFSKTDRFDPDVPAIMRMVSIAKSVWPPITDASQLDAIIAHHDLDLENPHSSVKIAFWAFTESIKDFSVIDFDDMLFLPLLLNAPFTEQDWVLVDEAQDTNDIQLEILSRLRAARYVFVGDEHQAIYGFRGANSDSMSRIAARFSCTALPLSYSFRCSKAVVAEAQRVLALPIH